MDKTRDQLFSASIEDVATENAVAIAFVDKAGHPVAAFNNNSICESLNPDGEFSAPCQRYCGLAAARSIEKHSLVKYECHAGLHCQALPVKVGDREMSAIIGRAFVDAEKYKDISDKVLRGDWQKFPVAPFFQNILLLSSGSNVNSAVEAFKNLRGNAHAANQDPSPTTIDSLGSVPIDSEDIPNWSGPAEQGGHAIRSLFSSLLDSDHDEAVRMVLDFISAQHGLEHLFWLEVRNGKLESSPKNESSMHLRTGISDTNEKLIGALSSDGPLVLRQTTGSKQQRKLLVFPLGLGRKVSAAIGVLDTIDDPDVLVQISRFCRSISPQLEILRLRSQVEHSKNLSMAIRRFGAGLKNVSTDDLWHTVTQKAAELLKAERASLMIYSKKDDIFTLKSMIGSPVPLEPDQAVDGHIARLVFEKNKALAVPDLTKANLALASHTRQYKTNSFLSCPVAIGATVAAVMNFTDPADGQAFDKDSIELFRAIAPQIAVAIDRANLKEKAGEFQHLSVTDPLTGLRNRRYLEERLAEETQRSTRHSYPMSFMMLDVDQFKSYNDRFGHPAGDLALKLVGQIIRDTVRSVDVAARYGGEEFSILLPQTTNDEAVMIGERLRSNIENAVFPHRPVTVSIGVASCASDLCVSSDVMSAADKALYQAKNSGRNRVVSYRDEAPIAAVRNR